MTSYCRAGAMGSWRQQRWTQDLECWVLWEGRVAGSSARPGPLSSLHPVCPALSLHAHTHAHTLDNLSNWQLSLFTSPGPHRPPSSVFPSFMQLDSSAMEESELGSSLSISSVPAFMSVEGRHAKTQSRQEAWNHGSSVLL